jgi:Asp/Glu/hydantoin racemase
MSKINFSPGFDTTMSEKYSTDELVESVEKAYLERMDFFERLIGSYPERNAQYDKRDAIIARLRAADRLCEAAKHPNFDSGIIFCESDPGLKKLRKAIAEYEGKEGK